MSRMSAWIAAAAIYREPRVLAVMFLGFANGLPLLLTASTLAIRLTESGVDLTTIGLFAMVGVPYSLKFLWAPLIDRLPLPVLSSTFEIGRAACRDRVCREGEIPEGAESLKK